MENQEKKPDTKTIAPFRNLLNQPSKDTVARIVELLKTGDIDAAYVGVGLKKFAKIAEEVKKDEGAWAIIEEETKKHQEGTKKTFTLYGAKITIATRGYWDYSQTEDPVLEAYIAIEKKVKELKKLREEYIQNESLAWEKRNEPKAGETSFGIKPFTLTWNEIPTLIFEEGVGEVSTNIATKKGQDQLRYSL